MTRPAATVGVASLAVLGITAVPAAADVDPDSGNVIVDVLAFNDFHGRIEANQQSAGAAVLAGAVDQLRGENEDTVLVSAGDNIGASTFTSFVQDDEPTLEALNGMGLFASAVGNHEFDQGADDLTGRVSDLADFPYLVANVEGDLPNIDEYAIYTAQEGTEEEVTIGFVGVVTPEVPSLVTPAGIEGLTFGSMLENANRVARQLSDGDETNGEADVVVVLAHDGAATADLSAATGSTDFGALVNGASDDIDAIVSGHTHVLYDHDVDGMAVTQASQYGEYLTKLSLTVDPESGDVASTEVAQLDLVDSVRNADGTTTYTPNYDADPDIEALVQKAKEVAEVEGAVELGTIEADLNRAQQANGDENRGGESTLGNFVADVHLWATQELGAEIAFMNPGGLRKDLTYGDDGVVTYKEAAEVQPFANTLVTKDLTGEQIYQVLEEQWQPAGASRPFLKLGVSAGFEYLYDPTAPAGERILGATLNDEPIVWDATYKVVMNSFLASGGDNFTTFAEGTNSADSGRVDLQATVDYFAAQEGTPVTPDLAQRAVGITVSGDVVPGARVTFGLSSLDFSTTEEDATEVQLFMGDQLLGTAPIDGTVVDTTDEVGRATIQATIPSAPGVYELAVVTDVGTDVAFPIELEGGTGDPGQQFGFFLNDSWTTKANHTFMYGRFSDEVLIGDWDGDGTDSITVRRGNVFYVSNEPRGGEAEHVFVYGRPGDTVLVGDWDGDGVDTLAVRRGAAYHVKNDLAGGPADKVVVYGRAGDQVVVGDWDADGADTFAVRRGAEYFVKNSIAAGNADQVVVYGKPGDVTLAGDWDGDGDDTFAVRRGATYYVKNTIAPGNADIVLVYGRANDEVYVGDWNGDGTDTLGVRRLP
ncbi:5'-nucleotidase C-terminal domain-containing protein [Georgenia sp. EYE_87]|uniref:bifunctional metallophosphatase/5'-nucleotidase n=1 Tax=Georgenia sp. EYE_87 TaxID=2853448 RepID=UPI0020044B5F|nr:5'-nucleotidase C-terminal domain-containing protein [Georgenia sp. EYE_87]MCK6209685.1 5'-nucleotidase C-terminal domain-containing protein [Georgenia sp. EYE_87]